MWVPAKKSYAMHTKGFVYVTVAFPPSTPLLLLTCTYDGFFFFELSQMDLICATLRFMFVWVFLCAWLFFFFFFRLKNETCLSFHGSWKRLIALSSSTSKTNTKHCGKQGWADLSCTQKTRGQIFPWRVKSTDLQHQKWHSIAGRIHIFSDTSLSWSCLICPK